MEKPDPNKNDPYQKTYDPGSPRTGNSLNFLKTLVAQHHNNDPKETNPDPNIPTTHKLLHTQRRSYDLRNFCEEIYAKKHVKKFLEGIDETGANRSTTIIFEKDLPEHDPLENCLFSSLVNTLLTKMFETSLSAHDRTEILVRIFSTIEGDDDDVICEKIAAKNLRMVEHKKKDVNLLAETLQGYDSVGHWLNTCQDRNYVIYRDMRLV